MASAPKFRYDAQAGRYRSALTGRFVPDETVRRWLDRALAESANRSRDLANRLRARDLTLAEWEREMRRAIKDTQGYAAMVARGGRAQMSPSDWGRVGARTKFHYRRLESFARDVASGKQRLDGSASSRARLYALSARPAYERERGRIRGERGFDEVRSIRFPGDSCAGCIEQEAKGWQRPNEYVYPGDRECRGNCRCRSEWRRAA